ncbi:hypothetical protein RRG08_019663 [Elysia crispata]|uniref:Uncharacterized protein n=1 Tax=Elysia crispata TaxID=231223 RepID=A0AAE0YAR6_9GAST|nr:hypothetical protein RRG08_019663 [Elysia crispata]
MEEIGSRQFTLHLTYSPGGQRHLDTMALHVPAARIVLDVIVCHIIAVCELMVLEITKSIDFSWLTNVYKKLREQCLYSMRISGVHNTPHNPVVWLVAD